MFVIFALTRGYIDHFNTLTTSPHVSYVLTYADNLDSAKMSNI